MRLFIALPFDDSGRKILADFVQVLRSINNTPISWSPPGRLHMTLEFLGERRLEDIQPLLMLCRDLSSTPATLFVNQLHFFPPGSRASVMAAGFGGEVQPVGSLVEELRQRISAAGFSPESRPFVPHVTLARCRQGLSRPSQLLMEKAAAPCLPLLPVHTQSPWLFESRPGRGGSEYIPLQRLGVR